MNQVTMLRDALRNTEKVLEILDESRRMALAARRVNKPTGVILRMAEKNDALNFSAREELLARLSLLRHDLNGALIQQKKEKILIKRRNEGGCDA